MIKVSMIASSVRPQLYEDFFKSLEGTSVEYEVVFAGNNAQRGFAYDVIDLRTGYFKGTTFKYIDTKNLKPAQCYEIARRHAKGEVIVWVADDCEFPNDVIGKAYKYWKSQEDEKLILSIQTREFYLDGGDGYCNMRLHSFIGGDSRTPLMAPLAMISREYLSDLGGFDRRYLCGQYENQVVMQAYAQGSKVEVFGDKSTYIELDHVNKSIRCGESKDRSDFLKRPFARGYVHDRKILESVCEYKDDVIKVKSFEPYEDKDILTKSQSYKGEWE